MTTARTRASSIGRPDGDGGTAGPTSISDIEAWVIADMEETVRVNVMQSSEKGGIMGSNVAIVVVGKNNTTLWEGKTT